MLKSYGSAYGFLASKEVKEGGVGNLGLQDRKLFVYYLRVHHIDSSMIQNGLPYVGYRSTSRLLAETPPK